MFSCKSESLKEPISLSASDTLTTDINMPTIMKIHDDKLLVVDLFSDGKMFTLYDLNTKQSLAKFGDKGHGHNEFLHVSLADFITENSKLSIEFFDSVKNEYTVLDVDSVMVDKCGGVRKSVLDFKKQISEMMRVGNGYKATGLFSGGKYAMFDKSFKFKEYQCDYLPNLSADNNKENIVKHAITNNGNTVFNADRKHFTQVVYIASVLSFFDVNNEKLEKVGEHSIAPFNYKVQDDHIINKEMEGYLSAFYGKEHIYALYCGVPESDGIATYGKEIYVFSQKGELSAKYNLDSSASQICVNKEETKLYVLSHEPKPSILIYDITQK